MDAIHPRPSAGESPRPARFTTQQSISLVLPAYNEEEVIAHAILEACEALAAVTGDYEVIVVDDGSRDRTAELVRQAAAANPRVRLAKQPRNMGYGAALKRGFSEASKELVGFTDADCQFDLRELDRLALLAEDYDIVSGYRIDRQDPWIRLVYSRGYNALIQMLLGTTVRDADCALKLFRREVIQSIDISTPGYLVNAEILAKARAQGRSLVEVGVTHRPRLGGVSKVSFLDVFPVLRAMARFWWSWALFPEQASGATRSQDGISSREKVAPGGAAGASGWTAAQNGWAFFSLFVLAVLLLLGNLGYALMEPDETRYAQIAAEMVRSGDYVTPTRLGEPYLDKPPLLYWATAGSYALFGVNEWAARLPTAIAAVMTVLVNYLFGRRLLGDRAAFLGGLALLGSVGFLVCGRYILMDGLLTLFTTSGLLALYRATTRGQVQIGWWLLGAFACGLGVMTKGPIALVLCVPPVLVARWLAGEKPIALRYWAVLVAVSAAIFLPWLVAIAQQQSEFVGYFFWKHNLQRFVSAFNHREPFWFYLPVLGGLMFPAILVAPLLVALIASRSGAVRSLRTRELGFVLLSGVWVVAFFSISSCKLPTYILPAAPCFALACGWAIDTAIRQVAWPVGLARWAGRTPRLLLRGSAGLAAIAFVVVLVLRLDGAAAALIAAISAGIVLTVLWLDRRTNEWSLHGRWTAAGGASLAAMGLVSLAVLPQVADYRSANREALGCLTQIGQTQLPVVYFNREACFSPFVARGCEVREASDENAAGLAQLLRSQGQVLVITNPPDREGLVKQLPEGTQLAAYGARGRIYLVTAAQSSDQLAARPGETSGRK